MSARFKEGDLVSIPEVPGIVMRVTSVIDDGPYGPRSRSYTGRFWAALPEEKLDPFVAHKLQELERDRDYVLYEVSMTAVHPLVALAMEAGGGSKKHDGL